MTNEQIREVFRKIASGERKHGSFLTGFAMSYIQADSGNESILRPVAIQLIQKYGLEGYAVESDNWKSSKS